MSASAMTSVPSPRLPPPPTSRAGLPFASPSSKRPAAPGTLTNGEAKRMRLDDSRPNGGRLGLGQAGLPSAEPRSARVWVAERVEFLREQYEQAVFAALQIARYQADSRAISHKACVPKHLRDRLHMAWRNYETTRRSVEWFISQAQSPLAPIQTPAPLPLTSLLPHLTTQVPLASPVPLSVSSFLAQPDPADFEGPLDMPLAEPSAAASVPLPVSAAPLDAQQLQLGAVAVHAPAPAPERELASLGALEQTGLFGTDLDLGALDVDIAALIGASTGFAAAGLHSNASGADMAGSGIAAALPSAGVVQPQTHQSDAGAGVNGLAAAAGVAASGDVAMFDNVDLGGMDMDVLKGLFGTDSDAPTVGGTAAPAPGSSLDTFIDLTTPALSPAAAVGAAQTAPAVPVPTPVAAAPELMAPTQSAGAGALAGEYDGLDTLVGIDMDGFNFTDDLGVDGDDFAALLAEFK
ncbi:hypothetical protein Q5752_001995 [Cryptotrichosporon argae]